MAQYILMCEWRAAGITYPEGSIVELDDERGERFCELQLAIRLDEKRFDRTGPQLAIEVRHPVRPRGPL